MNEIRYGFHASDLIVRPETRAVRADATIGLDTGGFDENESGALESVVAQRADVVGSQGTDVGSGFRSAVLAHWRNNSPVAERSAANI